MAKAALKPAVEREELDAEADVEQVEEEGKGDVETGEEGPKRAAIATGVEAAVCSIAFALERRMDFLTDCDFDMPRRTQRTAKRRQCLNHGSDFIANYDFEINR